MLLLEEKWGGILTVPVDSFVRVIRTAKSLKTLINKGFLPLIFLSKYKIRYFIGAVLILHDANMAHI